MTMNDAEGQDVSEKMSNAERFTHRRWTEYYENNPKMLTGTSVLTPIMIKKMLYDPEGRCTADFRYNVRERVKKGLIDLEFFIDLASKKDSNMVLNVETLNPVVMALLHSPVVYREPDYERAKIALIFIQRGFAYLTMKKPGNPLYQGIIGQARELSRLLVESFKSRGDES